MIGSSIEQDVIQNLEDQVTAVEERQMQQRKLEQAQQLTLSHQISNNSTTDNAPTPKSAPVKAAPSRNNCNSENQAPPKRIEKKAHSTSEVLKTKGLMEPPAPVK